jgi:hypothetical protein
VNALIKKLAATGKIRVAAPFFLIAASSAVPLAVDRAGARWFQDPENALDDLEGSCAMGQDRTASPAAVPLAQRRTGASFI